MCQCQANPIRFSLTVSGVSPRTPPTIQWIFGGVCPSRFPLWLVRCRLLLQRSSQKEKASRRLLGRNPSDPPLPRFTLRTSTVRCVFPQSHQSRQSHALDASPRSTILTSVSIRRWLTISQSDKTDKRLPRGQQVGEFVGQKRGQSVNQSSEFKLKKKMGNCVTAEDGVGGGDGRQRRSRPYQ